MPKARLQAALALLPTRGRIADAGAGDGLLARMLVARTQGVEVIATEPARGAFSRLAAACAGEERIQVRFGAGLAPLRGERLDAVAILGMGAHTILSILEDAAEHPETLFVLGPMQHVPALREGLVHRGLAISHERLAVEGGRAYEVIAARRAPSSPLDFLDAQLGPFLRAAHPPGFDLVCRQRLRVLRGRLAGSTDAERETLLRHILQIEQEYDGPRNA